MNRTNVLRIGKVAGFVTLAVFAAGCASSRGTVDATKSAWQSDVYVMADADPSSHSARVLDMLPEPANRTMQVGALRLPVHESPDTASPIVAWLDQGAAVTVTEWSRFVRAPETSSMTEVGERDFVPTWARVDCGQGYEGYVGARSLVSPQLYANMDEDASRELAEGTGDDSGQGFSEKRKKRLVAVKGAAGSFEQEGSDYPAAEAVIEAAVQVGTTDGFAGETLAAHDPDLATRLAEEMRVKEAKAEGGEDEGSSGGGMLGGLGGLSGIGGAIGLDSPEAQMALKVADIVAEMLEESEPTPLDEYMLARECMAAVLASAPIVPADDPDATRLREMGLTIAASSSLPYPLLGYQFILQDDDETVNAFAAPGGGIFFTTGMLDFLQTDDELAVVLGHEIAHMEERHGVMLALESGYNKMPAFRRIFKLVAEDELEGMIEDLLKDVDLPGDLKEQAQSEIVAKVKSLARDGFESIMAAVVDGLQQGQDQSVETAADLRGMSLAAANGYDPTALLGILERVEAETGDYGGASYSMDRLGEATEISPLLVPGYEAVLAANGGAARRLDAEPAVIVVVTEEDETDSSETSSDDEVDAGGSETDTDTETVVAAADDASDATDEVATDDATDATDEAATNDATDETATDDASDAAAEEAPAVIEPVEVEKPRAAPSGEIAEVLSWRGDSGRIGQEMLGAFADAESTSSSTIALAATTVQRLESLAASGKTPGTVKLFRVNLLRDEVVAVPGSNSASEVLVASSSRGFPTLLGDLVPAVALMDGVQAFTGTAATSRPVLAWDRRADRRGWQGWIVVMTR